MKLLKWLLASFILVATLGVLSIVGLYIHFAPELPDTSSLKQIELQTPLKVFTKDGKLISQYGEKRRIPLTLEQIPLQMQQAFLAIEDSRFYLHPGIDPIGIARAVFSLITTGKKKQGASTITQQVARNYFLSREKTFTRKIKEIFLAWNIEQELTKDEILLAYLNKIPLGHRSFGVGAASQVYYGKKPSELTLAQMTVIAGLPKAPSSLNPIRSPERSRARRNLVLKRMLDLGFIDQPQYQQASTAPTTAERHGADIDLYAPYLGEMVRHWMVNKYGKSLAYSAGFKVYTTVPSHLQVAAQQALADNINAYDQRHGYRGPEQQLWSIKPNKKTPELPQVALSSEAISQHLASVKQVKLLQPAVVIKVDKQSLIAQLKSGQQVEVLWPGLKWARSFVTDKYQRPAPKQASNIVSEGALIRITDTEDGWILGQIPQVSSALISLDPLSGAIKAIVGGYDFSQSQFNRATQAKRQLGSNIKPFIYSYAIERGFTLASIINDAPITQWDAGQGLAWRPKNSPPIYNGPTRLRLGLAQSKNVMSVKLIQEVGVEGTIKHLAKFGFNEKDLPRGQSLALGSASVSPLDAVTGFATFANGGYKVTPYFIERVEDQKQLNVFMAQPKIVCQQCQSARPVPESIPVPTLEDFSKSIFREKDWIPADRLAPRIISAQNAFLVSEMMRSAIKGGGNRAKGTGWTGTGWRAKALGRRDLGGKTGTTNQTKDTWFSGFSPGLVTTVWVGFDNQARTLGRTRINSNLGKGQVTGGEAGAKTAQPAWINYMKVALNDYPSRGIAIPRGITTVRIDRETGLRTTKADHSSRFEYFMKGTEPTEYIEPDNSAQHGGQISDNDSNFEDDIF